MADSLLAFFTLMDGQGGTVVKGIPFYTASLDLAY